MSKELIIDEKLPKIIMPKNKIQLFLDWYKSDICNEETIPMIFKEGYFEVTIQEYIKIKMSSILELNEDKYITQVRLLNELHKTYDTIVIHFNIIDNNTICLDVYSKEEKERIAHITHDISSIKTSFTIQKTKNALLSINNTLDSEYGLIIDISRNSKIFNLMMSFDDIKTELDDFSRNCCNFCTYLLVSSIWYLASIKNTKDENTIKIENDAPRYISKSTKRNRNKSNIRNITTPIYNFGLMKSTNVQKLSSKKKGWKISYEFQVRGHYRHYKSGKVVFIKPFEKGKGLEKKQTIIKLNPVF